MIKASAHFAVGYTRKVCLGYALAGYTTSGRSYAIVCDGSSESMDTDIGARLLARAAVKHIDVFGDETNPERVFWQAVGWAETLGVVPNALDATLMVMFETDNKQIRTLIAGDGVVAARHRDTGLIDYWVVRYPGGTGYLTYLFDVHRYETFISQTLGMRESRVSWGNHTIKDRPPHPTTWEDSGPIWTLNRDPGVYDIIVVMSSGVESFRRHDDEAPVPLREVLARVMGGEMESTSLFCAEHGWRHRDDFSMAVLYIDYPVSDSLRLQVHSSTST